MSLDFTKAKTSFDREKVEHHHSKPSEGHIIDRHWKYLKTINYATRIEDRPNDGLWNGDGLMPCGHAPKSVTVTRTGEWYDTCFEGHIYKRILSEVNNASSQ